MTTSRDSDVDLVAIGQYLEGLYGPEPEVTQEEAIEIAEDHVPTLDQADDNAPPPVTYKDWVPEQTRVVVYTTAPHKYPKDRTAVSRAQALAECKLLFGRVLEANYLPERFFFRVRRTTCTKPSP